MKQVKIILCATLLFFQMADAQNPYYDALFLKDKVNAAGKIVLQTDVQELLVKYFPGKTPDQITTVLLNKNPFFVSLFRDMGADAVDNLSLDQNKRSFSLSSIGGLNVTNFADGLAKFLVKRFKQELTIAFFQKFKDEISKIEELKTLFPETYKLLLVIDKDIYKFSAYLNLLRETFIKDLTNLYTNFKKLVELEKYKKYFEDEHPEAYTIITGSLYFIDQFSRGIHLGEAIANYDTADIKVSNVSLQHNIKNSVLLLQAISASFSSLSREHYWVPADSVKRLLVNTSVTRNIYFGFVFQKYGSISFYKSTSADSIRLDTLLAKAKRSADNLSRSLDEYKIFIETFADHAQEVSEYLSDLKGKKKEDIDYNDYYRLYNASFDLLEHSLTFVDLPYVNLGENVEENIRSQSGKWIYVARNTGDLYVDIRTKNYSSAILNVTSILDTVLVNYNSQEYINELSASLETLQDELETKRQNSGDRVSGYKRKVNTAVRKFAKDEDASYGEITEWLRDKNIIDTIVARAIERVITKRRELNAVDNHLKLKSTLLKYGSFASAVAQAQNSDDIEKAIESIALPTGSAAIKKNSIWNIALNAYLGGFYGNEYLKQSPGKKWASSLGVYAPVGVTLSRGFGKSGSASLFFTVIDVGTFAAFRLQDDSTKALPEVSLKNIFAPGVGLVYGIPRWPISVGWTWQYGPMIREINRKDDEININASNAPNHRWQFFLAVDIPIVNFYTKSR